MSTDAITILKEDHKRFKKLFREFKKTEDSSKKEQIVRETIRELTVHTHIENVVMYPEVRRLLPDLEDDILESYEEHHVADVLCAELHEMTSDDERFTAKFTVLIESVTHHVGEEEDDWFPKVREHLTRAQLAEIGKKMESKRSSAPKSPTVSIS